MKFWFAVSVANAAASYVMHEHDWSALSCAMMAFSSGMTFSFAIHDWIRTP